MQLAPFIYIVSLALYTASVSSQEVYKVINEDGSITFTDRPLTNAEKVSLPQKNTISLPPPPKTKKVKTGSQATQSASRPAPTITVVKPKPEATIRNNAGNMTIEALIQGNTPGRYVLHLDGKPSAPQKSGTFSLSGIDRGAHSFYIEYVSKAGKSLALSPKQTFYLHQASVLINPN